MVDQQTAVGKLLDDISTKLDGDDRTAFDQLVYALVLTEQTDCAKMLDEQLAEQYEKAQDEDRKHG